MVRLNTNSCILTGFCVGSETLDLTCQNGVPTEALLFCRTFFPYSSRQWEDRMECRGSGRHDQRTSKHFVQVQPPATSYGAKPDAIG
jgi:hypothetical protein